MARIDRRPIRPRCEPGELEHPTPRPASLESPAALRRLTSDSLFAGGTEIEIEHGDAVYRLRLTSLGKLILTK